MTMSEDDQEKQQVAVSSGFSSDARGRDTTETKATQPKFQPNGRLWAIILTCAVISLLRALENTTVVTALPHIVTELDLGENSVWVTNVFFLTGAAVQPLFGQLADIYGRRWVTMASIVLFTLGSGIAGGASNGALLITGRAVQGIGPGGIYIIVDIIVSDPAPLRLRGNYMAVILIVYAVGTAIGPWVGGEIIATTSWRWVFYINLPIVGASMVMVFLFLRVQHSRTQTAIQKLLRIDYIGNLILVGSTVAVPSVLTYGGIKYSWSSVQILSPLIIGLAGFILFMWYEAKAAEPVVPPTLFKNRTAGIIFATTFLNPALLYWVLFFLPIYFQAVLGTSAARAGILILPAVLFGTPGAVVAVLLLTKFGKHKPLHLFGFAAVAAIGSGFVPNTLQPAVQVQVDECYQAATTSAWSFMRSFGSIWGVAIPADVFNNRFSHISATTITDSSVRELFDGGNRAYENAYAAFVQSFPSPIRDQIVRSGAKAGSFSLSPT